MSHTEGHHQMMLRLLRGQPLLLRQRPVLQGLAMPPSRSMFIQTEVTPNPASLKFLPNRQVLGEDFGNSGMVRGSSGPSPRPRRAFPAHATRIPSPSPLSRARLDAHRLPRHSAAKGSQFITIVSLAPTTPSTAAAVVARTASSPRRRHRAATVGAGGARAGGGADASGSPRGAARTPHVRHAWCGRNASGRRAGAVLPKSRHEGVPTLAAREEALHHRGRVGGLPREGLHHCLQDEGHGVAGPRLPARPRWWCAHARRTRRRASRLRHARRTSAGRPLAWRASFIGALPPSTRRLVHVDITHRLRAVIVRARLRGDAHAAHACACVCVCDRRRFSSQTSSRRSWTSTPKERRRSCRRRTTR